MSLKLILKPEAEQDIAEVYQWYGQQLDSLGFSFMDELEKTLGHIQGNPKSCQVRYRKVRVAYTDRFPFGIHYLLEEHQVTVLAVLHTGRNPESWRRDRQL